MSLQKRHKFEALFSKITQCQKGRGGMFVAALRIRSSKDGEIIYGESTTEANNESATTQGFVTSAGASNISMAGGYHLGFLPNLLHGLVCQCASPQSQS
jgi:hypothetical protein